MKRNRLFLVTLCAAAVGWCSLGHAQGAISDLMSGKLVKPKVGQWAWYDLTAAQNGGKYVIREAVVDSEKVGGKTGYWVEFEIVPELGYRSVYKMLVTGTGNDPAKVHRIMRKEGTAAPEVVPVDESASNQTAPAEAKRESLGKEQVQTLSGAVEAEHFVVQQNGDRIDLWLSDEVRPAGIVCMRSKDGEMRLRNCGEGGADARSTLGGAPVAPEATGAKPDLKVEVKKEKKGSRPSKKKN